MDGAICLGCAQANTDMNFRESQRARMMAEKVEQEQAKKKAAKVAR